MYKKHVYNPQTGKWETHEGSESKGWTNVTQPDPFQSGMANPALGGSSVIQDDYAGTIAHLFKPEQEGPTMRSKTGLNTFFDTLNQDSTFKYNPNDSIYTPTERIIDMYANRRNAEQKIQKKYGLSDTDMGILRWQTNNFVSWANNGFRMGINDINTAVQNYMVDNQSFQNFTRNASYFDNHDVNDPFTQLADSYLWDLNKVSNDELDTWYESLSPFQKHQLSMFGFTDAKQVKHALEGEDLRRAIEDDDEQKINSYLGEGFRSALFAARYGLKLGGLQGAAVGAVGGFVVGAGGEWIERNWEESFLADLNYGYKNLRNAYFNTMLGTVEGTVGMAGTLASKATTGLYNKVTGKDLSVEDNWFNKVANAAVGGLDGIGSYLMSETRDMDHLNGFERFFYEGIAQTAGSILGFQEMGQMLGKTQWGRKDVIKLKDGTYRAKILNANRAELTMRTAMSMSQGNEIYKNGIAAGSDEATAFQAAVKTMGLNYGLLTVTKAIPGAETRSTIKEIQDMRMPKIVKGLAMDFVSEASEEVGQLWIADKYNQYTGAQEDWSDFSEYAMSAFLGGLGGAFASGIESMKVRQALNDTWGEVTTGLDEATRQDVLNKQKEYKAEGMNETQSRDATMHYLFENDIIPSVGQQMFRHLLNHYKIDFTDGYQAIQDYKTALKAEIKADPEHSGKSDKEIDKLVIKRMNNDYFDDSFARTTTRENQNMLNKTNIESEANAKTILMNNKVYETTESAKVLNNYWDAVQTDINPDGRLTMDEAISLNKIKYKVEQGNHIDTFKTLKDSDYWNYKRVVAEGQVSAPTVDSHQVGGIKGQQATLSAEVDRSLRRGEKHFKKYNDKNGFELSDYDYMLKEGIINDVQYAEAVKYMGEKSSDSEVNNAVTGSNKVEDFYNKHFKHKKLDKAKIAYDKYQEWKESTFETQTDFDNYMERIRPITNDKALAFLDGFEKAYDEYVVQQAEKAQESAEKKLERTKKANEKEIKRGEDIKKKNDEAEQASKEREKKRKEKEKAKDKEYDEKSQKKRQMTETDKPRSEMTNEDYNDSILDPEKKDLSKTTNEPDRQKTETVVTKQNVDPEIKKNLNLKDKSDVAKDKYTLKGRLSNKSNDAYLKLLNNVLETSPGVEDFVVAYSTESDQAIVIPIIDGDMDRAMDMAEIKLDSNLDIKTELLSRKDLNNEVIKANKAKEKQLEQNFKNEEDQRYREKDAGYVDSTPSKLNADIEKVLENTNKEKAVNRVAKADATIADNGETITKLQKENTQLVKDAVGEANKIVDNLILNLESDYNVSHVVGEDTTAIEKKLDRLEGANINDMNDIRKLATEFNSQEFANIANQYDEQIRANKKEINQLKNSNTLADNRKADVIDKVKTNKSDDIKKEITNFRNDKKKVLEDQKSHSKVANKRVLEGAKKEIRKLNDKIKNLETTVVEKLDNKTAIKKVKDITYRIRNLYDLKASDVKVITTKASEKRGEFRLQIPKQQYKKFKKEIGKFAKEIDYDPVTDRYLFAVKDNATRQNEKRKIDLDQSTYKRDKLREYVNNYTDYDNNIDGLKRITRYADNETMKAYDADKKVYDDMTNQIKQYDEDISSREQQVLKDEKNFFKDNFEKAEGINPNSFDDNAPVIPNNEEVNLMTDASEELSITNKLLGKLNNDINTTQEQIDYSMEAGEEISGDLTKKIKKLQAEKLDALDKKHDQEQELINQVKEKLRPEVMKKMQEKKPWKDDTKADYAEEIDIDDLIKYLDIDRVDQAMTNDGERKKFLTLIDSIAKEGLQDFPWIEYNNESGHLYIGEGNHRIQAMKMLGYDKVPAKIFIQNDKRSNLGVGGQIEPGLYPGTKTFYERKPTSEFIKALKKGKEGIPRKYANAKDNRTKILENRIEVDKEKLIKAEQDLKLAQETYEQVEPLYNEMLEKYETLEKEIEAKMVEENPDFADKEWYEKARELKQKMLETNEDLVWDFEEARDDVFEAEDKIKKKEEAIEYLEEDIDDYYKEIDDYVDDEIINPNVKKELQEFANKQIDEQVEQEYQNQLKEKIANRLNEAPSQLNNYTNEIAKLDDARDIEQILPNRGLDENRIVQEQKKAENTIPDDKYEKMSNLRQKRVAENTKIARRETEYGLKNRVAKLKDTITNAISQYGVSETRKGHIVTAARALKNKYDYNVDQTMRVVDTIFGNLDANEFDALRNVIILRSQFEDWANHDRQNFNFISDMPYEANQSQQEFLVRELQKYDAIVQANPELAKRLERYDSIQQKTKNKYLDMNYSVLGKDLSNQLNRTFYVKNEVEKEFEKYMSGKKDYAKNGKLRGFVDIFRKYGSKADMNTNVIDLFAMEQLNKQNEISLLEFVEELKGAEDKSGQVLGQLTNELDAVKGEINDSILNHDNKMAMNRLNGVIENLLVDTELPASDKAILEEYLKDPIGFMTDDGNIVETIQRMSKDYTNAQVMKMKQLAKDGHFDMLENFKEVVEFLKSDDASLGGIDLRHFARYVYNHAENVTGHNDIQHFLESTGIENDLSSVIEEIGREHIKSSDFLERIPDGNVVVDEFGNELSWYDQDSELGRLGSVLLSDYDNAEAMTKMLINQLMFNNNQDGYLYQGLKDGNFMIVDTDTAKVLKEMVTPMKARNESMAKLNSMFKKSALFGPENVMRYNINATASDIYRTMLTNPRIIKQVPQIIEFFKEVEAANMNYRKPAHKRKRPEQLYRSKKLTDAQRAKLQKEYNIFMQNFGRGQTKFTLQADIAQDHEVLFDEVNKMAHKEMDSPDMIAKASKGINKYFDNATGLSTMREQVMRFAYMMDQVQQFEQGKNLTYGAANKKQIEGMLLEAQKFEGEKRAELEHRALALLSNQNFINYNETSKFGRAMARGIMPFISFQEGNLKWHLNYFNNLQQKVLSSNSSMMDRTMGVGQAGISAAIMSGVAGTLWNWVMREFFNAPEDEQIPEYMKTGNWKMGDTTINSYVQLPGGIVLNKGNTTMDLLDWTPFADDRDKNLAGWAKSIGGKTLSMLGPGMKAASELALGGDLYGADFVKMDKQWDRGDLAAKKIAQVFGLGKSMENTINIAKGLPGDYYSSDRSFNEFGKLATSYFKETSDNMVRKVRNDKEASYKALISRQYEYKEDVLGQTSGFQSGEPTEKQLIKDRIKKGIKFGDQEFVMSNMMALIQYMEEEGRTKKEQQNEIKQMFKSSFSVVGALPEYAKDDYLNNYLNEKEKEMMKQAIEYEKKLLGDWWYLVYQ